MTEKRIYRKGLRYHAAPPQGPVAFGERDEMSAHAAGAGVPLCDSESVFYGKRRRCTRAAGHAEGAGPSGGVKHQTTHVDASERGFIARAQWTGPGRKDR